MLPPRIPIQYIYRGATWHNTWIFRDSCTREPIPFSKDVIAVYIVREETTHKPIAVVSSDIYKGEPFYDPPFNFYVFSCESFYNKNNLGYYYYDELCRVGYYNNSKLDLWSGLEVEEENIGKIEITLEFPFDVDVRKKYIGDLKVIWPLDHYGFRDPKIKVLDQTVFRFIPEMTHSLLATE